MALLSGWKRSDGPGRSHEDLAARRFPDRIVRDGGTGRTRSTSTANRIPGPVTLTEHRASLQPIANEDLDLVEGTRLLRTMDRLTFPEPEALIAAREFEPADMVTLHGRGDFAG